MICNEFLVHGLSRSVLFPFPLNSKLYRSEPLTDVSHVFVLVQIFFSIPFMSSTDLLDVVVDQNNSNGKRMKLAGSKVGNGGLKAEVEASSAAGDKPADQSNKPSEPPKQDYIHVRARRGQATDSHSLAERVIHTQSF